MTTTAPAVSLPQLHDPDTGRLDAKRIAAYLRVPLTQLAPALGKKYQTLHKTPAAPSVQAVLFPIKHTLELLNQLIDGHGTILVWLNSPHPQLGMQTPLQLILDGHVDAVEGMLQGALWGIPS